MPLKCCISDHVVHSRVFELSFSIGQFSVIVKKENVLLNRYVKRSSVSVLNVLRNVW